MLRSIKDLESLDIRTSDGKIGNLRTIYFDRETMKVLYMVVDTRKWLPGKQVLLSPNKIIKPLEGKSRIDIELAKEELEKQPHPEYEKPLAVMKEEQMLRGLFPSALWFPAGVEPQLNFDGNYLMLMNDDELKENPEKTTKVRSTKHIEGYRIEALDGKIGHLDDFIVDTADWKIRYLVVDTSRILPGKKVIISPEWVKEYDWEGKRVIVDHTKGEIKDSPGFDPYDPINRKYEAVLYDYYGRPYYWIDMARP